MHGPRKFNHRRPLRADFTSINDFTALRAPAGEGLFARSAPGVLQVRLALLVFLALRFADEESAAANVLRFVKLVVLGCVHQVCVAPFTKNVSESSVYLADGASGHGNI